MKGLILIAPWMLKNRRPFGWSLIRGYSEMNLVRFILEILDDKAWGGGFPSYQPKPVYFLL